MRRVGYLIPEFPAQTHAFFWREMKKVREHGVEPVVMSSRRPPPGLVVHGWTNEAVAATTYLTPPTPGLALRGAASIGRNPVGWARCLRQVAEAEGLDAKGKARLAALAVVGAEVAAIARAEKLDHLHAHSAADSAHLAMFGGFLAGIPYSVMLHGPMSDYGPNQRNKWRHAAFGIVITQKLMGEITAAIGDELPPMHIAPMGVDTANYVREQPYAPFSGEGPLRVFSCGRLNEVKGHHHLAEAIGLLRQRGLDAQLRVAGEDEQGGSGFHVELQQRIDALGLDDGAVTLLGAIPERQVRAELDAAHVFSLASYHEPLGVAIMEAMALSVPVVVTHAGGVKELVADGVDGLTVDPKDPDALARRIEEIARDPSLAHRLGEAGRETVVERFDSGRSADLIARGTLGTL